MRLTLLSGPRLLKLAKPLPRDEAKSILLDCRIKTGAKTKSELTSSDFGVRLPRRNSVTESTPDSNYLVTGNYRSRVREIALQFKNG